MKQLPSIKRTLKPNIGKAPGAQRGEALIESLIAMVLMAIIGMGEVYVSSKAMVAQRQMRLQEFAVNQMRAALVYPPADLCLASAVTVTLPKESIASAVRDCNSSMMVSFRGDTFEARRPAYMEATHDDGLGGTVVVGGSWASVAP